MAERPYSVHVPSLEITDDLMGSPVLLNQTFDANANGNRTGLSADIGYTYTQDFTNTYTYDNLGQMTSVVQNGRSGYDTNAVTQKEADFGYDADGNLTSIDRSVCAGSGMAAVANTTYTYDDDSQLTKLVDTAQGNTLAGYTWTYDNAGRLTQTQSYGDAPTATRTSNPSTWATATYSYYQSADQLAGATYSNWQSPQPANE